MVRIQKKKIGLLPPPEKNYLRVPPPIFCCSGGWWGNEEGGRGNPWAKRQFQSGRRKRRHFSSFRSLQPPKKMPGRQANKIQDGEIKLLCHSVLRFLEENGVSFWPILANKVPYLANHPVDFACCAPPQGRERLLFAPLLPPVME